MAGLFFLLEDEYNLNLFTRVDNRQYFIDPDKDLIFYKEKNQDDFFQTDRKSISYEGYELCREKDLLVNQLK